MRAAPVLAAVALAAVSIGAVRHGAATKGVANAALVSAARTTPLKAIDYNEDLCRNDRTVAQWIGDLGPDVASVSWSGGSCLLTNDLNPIDSGSDWCAQATIHLRHPKSRRDTPMIEIYFEKPHRGVPGAAYAFRGDMLEADGGESGLIRFRSEFEGAWTERFPASKATLECAEE